MTPCARLSSRPTTKLRGWVTCLTVPAATGGDPHKDHRRARAFTLRDVLAGEKKVLVALAVTLDEFRAEIRKFAPRSIRELNPNKQWAAGLIVV